MKKVLVLCFMFVITFMLIGCEDGNGKVKDEDLNANSYRELFTINMITLTQNINYNKIVINDKNEINTIVSILKLETQYFYEEYLKLEEELIQKLNNYVKIEIIGLSENDSDYLCYYITENGILYEQIDNFVRYTEQHSIDYSELLNFIFQYEE